MATVEICLANVREVLMPWKYSRATQLHIQYIKIFNITFINIHRGRFYEQGTPTMKHRLLKRFKNSNNRFSYLAEPQLDDTTQDPQWYKTI